MTLSKQTWLRLYGTARDRVDARRERRELVRARANGLSDETREAIRRGIGDPDPAVDRALHSRSDA